MAVLTLAFLMRTGGIFVECVQLIESPAEYWRPIEDEKMNRSPIFDGGWRRREIDNKSVE